MSPLLKDTIVSNILLFPTKLQYIIRNASVCEGNLMALWPDATGEKVPGYLFTQGADVVRIIEFIYLFFNIELPQPAL